MGAPPSESGAVLWLHVWRAWGNSQSGGQPHQLPPEDCRRSPAQKCYTSRLQQEPAGPALLIEQDPKAGGQEAICGSEHPPYEYDIVYSCAAHGLIVCVYTVGLNGRIFFSICLYFINGHSCIYSQINQYFIKVRIYNFSSQKFYRYSVFILYQT